MINVRLHPTVNIRKCCSFEKWSLIWAMLVRASGEQAVCFLWCMTCWDKRPNWGLKTRIFGWQERWHMDHEMDRRLILDRQLQYWTESRSFLSVPEKSLRFNLSLVLQRVAKTIRTRDKIWMSSSKYSSRFCLLLLHYHMQGLQSDCETQVHIVNLVQRRREKCSISFIICNHRLMDKVTLYMNIASRFEY